MLAIESMADRLEYAYIGRELDLFALAKNWKNYVKDRIASYIRGDVLEVGAGIGGTTVALHDGTARRWVCLEPDAVLAMRLHDRLRACSGYSTTSIVIGNLDTFATSPCFDCILYIDVLEHIEDDYRQMDTASRLVRPGGHIVILSPAHRWLFSEFDSSIGHRRRYDKKGLRKLTPERCTEQNLTYLDSIGILLALGNAVVLHRAMPTEAQILTWDRLCIPVSRLVDRLLLGNVGKSILAVWRKR
jgi:SAM-dependent methyltransferase